MRDRSADDTRVLQATATVDIAWMEQQLAAPSAEVLGAFSAMELADAGYVGGRSQGLAARWAAKQACLQLVQQDAALGRIGAADFAIERDGYGAPSVVFTAQIRALLDRHRLRAIGVSLTHDAVTAAAVAIAEPVETTVPIVGKLLYHVVPFRRRVILTNLRRVFGERISERGITRLAQAHYAHCARLVFEFLQFRWLSAARRASMVRVENADALRRAADRGRGVLVVTAHLGNWEVATVSAALNFPEYRGRFHIVRRHLWPRWFYNLLINRLRRSGIGVLEKKGSLDTVLERLGAGEVVVFVMDQHAAGREGVPVEFFGQPASVFRSPAIIARATGAPVVAATSWRDTDGRHVIRFEEALPTIECDDPEEGVRANTRAYIDAIERFIVRHPEQWGMWMHRMWKGSQLSRHPAPDGSKERAPDTVGGRELFARLLGECLHVPLQLVAILISLVCLGGARLYLTWLVKLGVEPLAHGDGAVIRELWTKGALTAVLLIAGLFASRYLLNSVNQALVLRLRDAAQARLLNARVGALREFRSGELLSRIFNDAGLLAGFVRDILKRLVGESIVIVGGLAFMFYLEWRLALVTCLMGPVVAVLLNQLGLVIRRRGRIAQQEVGKLSALLNEQLRGLTTIKGFQTEAVERDRFAQQNAEYRRQVMRSEQWSALLVSTVSVVGAALLFGILWYGSSQVLAGRITSASLLAFCLFAVQTVEPVRRLSEVHGTLQTALAAAGRLYEVIDFPEVEAEGDVALPVSLRGQLRFESVCFRYRPDEPVLADLDLLIAARETVALVGASGGGKSTVANLLMRFLDPTRGRILIDGLDLRTLRLADLRRAICVVEQEPFILSGSLIDNIRYGSWQAPPAEVAAAVTLAGLDSWISSLPGGLQGQLLEGGGDLSGGQKQRIALARAIVRAPAVLILDEATSALDSESERRIFTQLDDWLRQRTVIVMAHRLATISRFDRVLVLEKGSIVGDGGVPDLLRHCPAFGQLFAEQLSPLGWGQDAGAGTGSAVPGGPILR